MRKRFRLLGFLVLLPSPVFAAAYSTQGPLFTRTQHPVYLQTVNFTPSRATVLPPGEFEFRIDQDFSNIFEQGTNGATQINLDMELYRFKPVILYGFSSGIELGVEIPFTRFDGGFLDSFIQDFHNFFGFPNGGRSLAANGAFRYRVAADGNTYDVPEQGNLQIGDITLLAKKQVWSEGRLSPAVAMRTAFKFPSGNADRGIGSDNVGFGLGLALEKSYKRIHGYLNLNYLVEGATDILQELVRDNFFHFVFSGEFSFSKRVSAVAQLDGGSARLKGTGLYDWHGMPLDFVIGFAGDHPVKGGGSFFWQIGFSEDITADGPSVDFTLHSTFGLRFPLGRSRIYQGDFLAKN